jgi:hypothetical protein
VTIFPILCHRGAICQTPVLRRRGSTSPAGIRSESVCRLVADLVGYNIPITEHVHGQTDSRRDVTVASQAKQVPADGHPTFSSRLFHHIAEPDLAPALDGLGVDTEEGGDLHCKRFTEKLEAIVGLYLNPAEHAIVLCVDGKKPDSGAGSSAARPAAEEESWRHDDADYKRNGRATLLPALNTLDATMIGMCQERHRHSGMAQVPTCD